MVRYFYAWTPLVVVGAVVLLALPWLGLIALVIAALAALASLVALARATVTASLAVGHAIGHRWHDRSAAPQPSRALVLVRAQARVPRGSRARRS
jgi:type IV secretory pathway protease TraF